MYLKRLFLYAREMFTGVCVYGTCSDCRGRESLAADSSNRATIRPICASRSPSDSCSTAANGCTRQTPRNLSTAAAVSLQTREGPLVYRQSDTALAAPHCHPAVRMLFREMHRPVLAWQSVSMRELTLGCRP